MPSLKQYISEAKAAGATPEQIAAIPMGYWKLVGEPNLVAQGHPPEKIAVMRDEWFQAGNEGADGRFYADRVARGLPVDEKTLENAKGYADATLIDPITDVALGLPGALGNAIRKGAAGLFGIAKAGVKEATKPQGTKYVATRGGKVLHSGVSDPMVEGAVAGGFNSLGKELASGVNLPPKTVTDAFVELLKARPRPTSTAAPSWVSAVPQRAPLPPPNWVQHVPTPSSPLSVPASATPSWVSAVPQRSPLPPPNWVQHVPTPHSPLPVPQHTPGSIGMGTPHSGLAHAAPSAITSIIRNMPSPKGPVPPFPFPVPRSRALPSGPLGLPPAPRGVVPIPARPSPLSPSPAPQSSVEQGLIDLYNRINPLVP